MVGLVKKRRVATAGAAFTMVTLWSAIAHAAVPPLDCRKAKGAAVDQEICGSSEFRAMDREVTALYDRGMASFAPQDRQRLEESQRGFFKRRRGCEWAAHHSAHPGVAIEECVRTIMEGRVHALRAAVDRGAY